MNLYLYEEIMLLALRDDKGTLVTSYVEQAVAGAVFAELLLARKVSVSEDKKKLIEVKDSSPLGDPIIDECLALLNSQSKPISSGDLITKFGGIKELRHKVARQLCNRDILRAEQDKIMFIFTRRTYPEVNPEPEQAIIKRIHAAIFDSEDDIDPRTIVLISLAKSAGLLVQNFDAKAIRAKKDRIEQIVSGELAGESTREVISAYETAVLVATIIPTLVTTIVVSS